MAQSRLRRAVHALADPWSLLAASVGAGAAWALAFPLGGIGAVGIGMLGVAAAAGAVLPDREDQASGTAEPELIPGTVQDRSVRTLETYLADLTRLPAAPETPLLAEQAADAVAAAASARRVARTVARSVDQLDAALARAGEVARAMTAADRVAELIARMQARRSELLAQLAAAVDGVGELYARLLELAATSGAMGVDAVAGPDPVAEVNLSLDAIREAFADLETAAHRVTDRLSLPDDASRPPSF